MNYCTLKRNLSVPLITIDKNYIIINYNDATKSIIGNELDIGVQIDEVFDSWIVNNEANIVLTMHNGNHLNFTINEVDNPDHTLLIGITTKTSNHISNKIKKIKSLNRDLSAVIENSYDAIYITDRNGKTLNTNSAIEKISGIPKEYYIGKSVDSLISRGILKASVTHLVVAKQRTVSLVQENYEGKMILLTGAPLFNDDGEVEKVVTNIRDLSELNELQEELSKVRKLNEEYRKELSVLKENKNSIPGAIIKSEQMQTIFETAERVANIDATILITGETGVGKDVLARYIYDKSVRAKDGEYIKVNCGAIPGDLLESELFGYEAGAFTGANPNGKVGLFEAANNGVVFLDEIGEMPTELQVKLLRVLQEGEIQRIGGIKTQKVNVRIIAATNRDLKRMIDKEEFREDLFYRLNVIPFTIPPLRNRKSDILPLIQYFLDEANEKYNMKKKFSDDLKKFFYTYRWPGNVRELSNLVERLVVTNLKNDIKVENLPDEYQKDVNLSEQITVSGVLPLKDAVELAEEKVLLLAAQQSNSTYEVAELLEVSQPTVVRRFKKYGINLKELIVE